MCLYWVGVGIQMWIVSILGGDGGSVNCVHIGWGWGFRCEMCLYWVGVGIQMWIVSILGGDGGSVNCVYIGWGWGFRCEFRLYWVGVGVQMWIVSIYTLYSNRIEHAEDKETLDATIRGSSVSVATWCGLQQPLIWYRGITFLRIRFRNSWTSGCP